MRRFVLIAALAALATPALAGVPVTLKADAVDADGLVTLGDLFDGAGAAGKTPVATRNGATLMLDAYAVQAAARRAGLDWPNAEGFRRIVVRGGTAASAAAPAAGKGNVDVLTWARSLAAGEVVQAADLIWGKAALAPAGAAKDPDVFVGMAARHAIREGAPATTNDVSAVQVVKRDDVLTVTFDQDGVSLTVQAKAMGPGAVGDTIGVQNTASKKVVQAVVTGPGQAAVGPGADQVRQQLTATRVALR
jgi:flagella basal body P-ring formation protein FlgA